MALLQLTEDMTIVRKAQRLRIKVEDQVAGCCPCFDTSLSFFYPQIVVISYCCLVPISVCITWCQFYIFALVVRLICLMLPLPFFLPEPWVYRKQPLCLLKAGVRSAYILPPHTPLVGLYWVCCCSSSSWGLLMDPMNFAFHQGVGMDLMNLLVTFRIANLFYISLILFSLRSLT